MQVMILRSKAISKSLIFSQEQQLYDFVGVHRGPDGEPCACSYLTSPVLKYTDQFMNSRHYWVPEACDLPVFTGIFSGP